MVRRSRELAAGGTYHVWSRGIARRGVFVDDEDRRAFIQRLTEDLQWAGAELFAYCLMGNQVHAALRTGDVSLPRIFHRTLTWYACRFNRRHAAAGHLFGAHFGSRRLEGDDDLVRVIRTIHRNPVEAGFVDRAEAWNWSSFASYRDGRFPEVLRVGEERVLSLLGDLPTNPGSEFDTFNESPRVADRVLERPAPSTRTGGAAAHPFDGHAKILAELSARVALRCGTTPSRIIAPGRTIEGVHARSVFLLAAVDGLGVPLPRVAYYIQCPPHAAYKALVEARLGTGLPALAASILTTCRIPAEALPAPRKEVLPLELR